MQSSGDMEFSWGLNIAIDRTKAEGIHYTPPELARFLARSIAKHLPSTSAPIHVVDPACGDGALLLALAQAVPSRLRSRLVLTGYELDASALEHAGNKLLGCGAGEVLLKHEDFLAPARPDGALPFGAAGADPQFDCVIANPPYVRTQVLGADAAQSLARRFGLTGRVDLSHAFAFAMGRVLKKGGVLGLLTSNRFLTTNSGEALRRLLRTEFQMLALYDLGDTKLFSAAVLPAIVVARKGDTPNGDCHFARAYESRKGEDTELQRPHILDALADCETRGFVGTPQGVFLVEKGTLSSPADDGETWSLSTPEYAEWLKVVARNQRGCFGDVASIRVGIKTTADKVFVRSDWESLAEFPEEELLHPLITHRDAGRWRVSWAVPKRTVLYPYDMHAADRQPISLSAFPRARKYLGRHEERLRSRRYVLEAGRQWYEIWVPQRPSDWAVPKLVFPDISEMPKFFLDRSGAVVQGDCYWMTLKEDVAPVWLLVMLAVANSSFGTKYYDVAFHNKLYAGRRRFMTQYVKKFPLPRLGAKALRKLSRLVEELVRGSDQQDAVEAECDRLIWQSFGLSKDADR